MPFSFLISSFRFCRLPFMLGANLFAFSTHRLQKTVGVKGNLQRSAVGLLHGHRFLWLRRLKGVVPINIKRFRRPAEKQ